MRSIRLLLAAALVGGLVAAAPVAAGAGTTQERERAHKASEQFVDLMPCVSQGDDPASDFYLISLTFNAIWKRTTSDNGAHETFTQTGTFLAQPVTLTDWDVEVHDDHEHIIPLAWEPRAGESFSGHFTIWGGWNESPGSAGGTFTFSINGKGSEGSRLNFKAVEHVNADATFEEIRRAFFKEACH